MKKSLSLLLAIALVVSMFGSLAYAADNGLTAQQKYDALAAKGIFSGINGEAALDQPMTRAQFARVAALVLGLEGIGNPDTKVVTEKPFNDVELGTWYVEEIAAVKEAGIIVGNPDGTFKPNANITVQELAVMIGEMLGLEPVEGAEIEGAANWAARYIQAIQDAGIAFPTNYAENALRADLASLAFAAAEVLGVIAPEKVSVVSAQATGVKKITVTLDRAVDTEKAKLTVKRDASTLSNTTVEWSDDKKSAVINLPSVITEAKYTVTLSGLDENEVAKASAEFQGEKEEVKTLEFVTASETLPNADGVQVEVLAKNQYGEAASFPAGAYNVHGTTYLNTVTKKDDGTLVLNLNFKAGNAVKDERVPVTVIHTESSITINKVFVVGDAPIVSNVQYGELKIDGDKDGEKTDLESGDKATLPVQLFDQYGVLVNTKVIKPADIKSNIGVHLITVPNDQKLKAEIEDYDGDGYYEIRLEAQSVDRDTQYAVTTYANGSGKSATKNVTIVASKVPATVEWGNFDETLAQKDGTKYIPLIVRDAKGNQLSADDIVKAAGTGPSDSKFTYHSSNPNVIDMKGIVKSGEHKGKMEIEVPANGAKGNAQLNIQVIGTGSQARMSLSVSDVRVPTSIYISEAPASKMVMGYDGAGDVPNKIKVKVRDQYGKDLNKNAEGSVNYYVYVTFQNNGDAGVLFRDADTAAGGNAVAGKYTVGGVYDKDLFFVVPNAVRKTGSARVTFELLAEETGKNAQSLATATTTVDVINGATANLTYEVSSVGTILAIDGRTNVVLGDVAIATSRHARDLSVSAKDSAGNKVALPGGIISRVTTSHPGVVTTSGNKVLGAGEGKATVTAFFKSPVGEKFASQEITTNKALPVVESISTDGTVKEISNTALNGASIFNGSILKDLVVKDQYGTEYKANDGHFGQGAKTYDNLLNISYTISDVKFKSSGTSTLSIDANNQIAASVPANIDSFVITAVAPNGKSVSVEVFVK